MSTVNKFGTTRLLDPSNANLDGQARVNAEIFTAVEILGRKLERVEAERDRLARRLALIESAATVDEKTGKLYLPVVMNQDAAPHREYATPKWIASASLMSSAVALFALGLVLFRTPEPALTKDQLAVLDSLRNSQFTQLAPESKGWKDLATAAPDNNTPIVSSETPTTPPAAAIAQPQPVPAQQTAEAPAVKPPDTSGLAKPERTAEVPKAADTQGVAPVLTNALTPPPLPSKTATAEKAEAPEKAPVKLAKKTAPPTETAAAPDKTATVIPTSENNGGIAPDTALPEKLAQLEKRAYQGIPEAQHDLATLYAAGTLVPQDYHRAAYWFTKAADGGVANAHYNMGVIYHQGLGVPVDLVKALGWYEKAAELGHPEAMYNLGIAYIEGIGTKVDIEKGVSYFKRAANAGVVQAAYNLGVLYESNFIGPIDTKKAAEWYQVAAKQGHTEARDALARLKGGGSSATPDSGDQALTLADKVEPAAGGGEEAGEGDSSPSGEGSHSGPKSLLADIQRIFIKQGLLPGKPDGVLSQQTEDVIRASEKKLGLTVDGQPSQELLEKLLQAPLAAAQQLP